MNASPSDNLVGSIINDSIASMNDSLFLPRITQNDESILSPKSSSPQSTAPYSTADFGTSTNAANAIYNRVLKDLQTAFSQGGINFFQQLEHRIESIVNLKMNSSTYIESLQRNVSTPSTSQANPTIALEEKIHKFDEEYEDFVDKYSKFNKINDKIETTNESLSIEIDSVKADIVELEAGLRQIRLNADENLAKIVQESQSPPTESITKPLQQRVQGTELQCEQLSVHC